MKNSRLSKLWKIQIKNLILNIDELSENIIIYKIMI